MPEAKPEIRYAYQVLAFSVVYTTARDVYHIATGNVPRDLDTRTNSYKNRRLRHDLGYRKSVLKWQRDELLEIVDSEYFELYLESLKINSKWFTTILQDALNQKPTTLEKLKKILKVLKNDATKTYGTTGRGGKDWRALDASFDSGRDRGTQEARAC